MWASSLETTTSGYRSPKNRSGQSNEAVDDFASDSEVLRDAAEDMPPGATRADIEKTQVLNQSALPKINCGIEIGSVCPFPPSPNSAIRTE